MSKFLSVVKSVEIVLLPVLLFASVVVLGIATQENKASFLIFILLGFLGMGAILAGIGAYNEITDRNAHFLGLIYLGLAVLLRSGVFIVLTGLMSFLISLIPAIRENLSDFGTLAGLTLILLGIFWIIESSRGRGEGKNG